MVAIEAVMGKDGNEYILEVLLSQLNALVVLHVILKFMSVN